MKALRGGGYEKGRFVPGQSEPPPGATGYCAIGLPAMLFNIYFNIPTRMKKTLGLTRKDLDMIQNHWNDSSLTFPQIADLIEYKVFDNEKV